MGPQCCIAPLVVAPMVKKIKSFYPGYKSFRVRPHKRLVTCGQNYAPMWLHEAQSHRQTCAAIGSYMGAWIRLHAVSGIILKLLELPQDCQIITIKGRWE